MRENLLKRGVAAGSRFAFSLERKLMPLNKYLCEMHDVHIWN